MFLPGGHLYKTVTATTSKSPSDLHEFKHLFKRGISYILAFVLSAYKCKMNNGYFFKCTKGHYFIIE